MPDSGRRGLSRLLVQRSDSEIRDDIDKMRKQALERLENLAKQYEELQEKQQEAIKEATQHENAKPAVEPHRDDSAVKSSVFFEEQEEKEIVDPVEEFEAWRQQTSPRLLDNTRWRVAFNIGREPGTWMPVEWGKSGDRLRFQVVVDFTSELFEEDDDEFFGGEKKYVCRVADAFCYPEGVGSMSVGRRAVKFDSEGLYQVAKGQGPAGTDILRFSLKLLEDIRHQCESDVFVPAGSIYGTCGYFSTKPHSHAVKDGLCSEHLQLSRHLDDINRQIESEGNIFHQVALLKDKWDLHDKLENLSVKVQHARTQDPERSRLRLSRKGDVGLSKEGGVCCKVNKGMSIEYRILGKLEMGSVDRRMDTEDSSTGKLRP